MITDARIQFVFIFNPRTSFNADKHTKSSTKSRNNTEPSKITITPISNNHTYHSDISSPNQPQSKIPTAAPLRLHESMRRVTAAAQKKKNQTRTSHCVHRRRTTRLSRPRAGALIGSADLVRGPLHLVGHHLRVWRRAAPAVGEPSRELVCTCWSGPPTAWDCGWAFCSFFLFSS